MVQNQKEYEAAAANIKKFMTQGEDGKTEEFPKIAILIVSYLWGAVCSNFEIKKAVQVIPENGGPQDHLSMTVYKAVHRRTGKTVLIVDHILTPEENQPESMPCISVRLLCLAGAKRVIIISAVTATDQLLKNGDLCIVKQHFGFHVNNPLVGPNFDDWGTRFPDMSKTYKTGKTKAIRRELRDHYHIRNVKALWMPALKGYQDETERAIAKEILHFDVVTYKGLSEAVIAHQMGVDNEVLFLGVVARKYNETATHMSHMWSSLASFFDDGFDLTLQ